VADALRTLVVVSGDSAGICDPETGVCALPDTQVEAGTTDAGEALSDSP